MHDLSCESFLSKYTLRCAPRDPVTGTMMALTAAGSAMSASGTIAGGRAAADAGVRSQQAMEFRAKQEEQAANESRAVAQRSAFEARRKGTLLQSTLIARAAAGGGGVDDPTVLELAGGIAQRSEYDALFDLWKGESRARGLEDTATADRFSGESAVAEGKAKQKASQLSAIGTIIGGAGSMFRQYKYG